MAYIKWNSPSIKMDPGIPIDWSFTNRFHLLKASHMPLVGKLSLQTINQMNYHLGI